MTSANLEPQPGKLRTWWHPLLASLLRWQLGEHYLLEEEVPVGKKPLQIDILLLRRVQGALSPEARRMLAGLAEYLNEWTLLEFKSPSDTLRTGDFQTFLAYALLYRAQQLPLLPVERLTLLVVAPRLSKPYRDELTVCNVTPAEEQPGIWRLSGGVALHAMWLLETEVLAGLDHPLLTAFSPQFLRQRTVICDQLRQGGYERLMVYLTQQIVQFRLQGEAFAMQHLNTSQEMDAILTELWNQLPPEERLENLPLERRLRGLTLEQRMAGLSREERHRLIALLQQDVES